jgi:RHS repeat-associated protein
LGTDKLFTGQRLDDTGLYYYGARYYDPTIGRFISPDSIVQSPNNPQSLNRYSYCLNNPLRYTDPTGQLTQEEYILAMTEYGVAPSTNPEDNMNNITFTSESTVPNYPPTSPIPALPLILPTQVIINDQQSSEITPPEFNNSAIKVGLAGNLLLLQMIRLVLEWLMI